MKCPERFRKGSLGRNAGWMFLGQGLTFFVQAGYFILLARLLGSQQYGIFVGAAAAVSIASQYSSLGSGWVLLRHVSQDPRKFPEYWGNAILTTLTTGFAIVLLLKLFGSWMIGPSAAAIVVLVAIGECICARLSDCAGQAFQAFENLRWTATLTALTSVVRLLTAAAMILLFHHATVKQWAVAWVAVSIVSALVAVGTVSVRLGRPMFRPGLLSASATEGIGFSFACSTTVVYNDVDKAMLSHYGMTAANGTYSMAYKIVDISCVPIRSLHSAALPRFFKKGSSGVNGSVGFATKILQKTLPYAVVAAGLMFLFSGFIPSIVGKSFENSATALRWLCLLPALRSLHLSAGDTLTGAGYQRYRTVCQVSAAALNFGLNLFMIPAFSWRGAAWSSLATDGLLAVANWTVLSLVMKKERNATSVLTPVVCESEMKWLTLPS
jgi:O-antigen/teichoic acid export membrane protein